MNGYGLTEAQWEMLTAVLRRYPAVTQAILYGSRAKGNFTERSDVDLVVVGQGLDRHLIAQVQLDLADSDLPYLVDVQAWDEVVSPALRAHIERVGVVVFNLADQQEAIAQIEFC